MKIKKGDMVKIISGRDRGKQGRILKVFLKENRVTVENINLRKKHVRPKRGGEKGQRVEVPAPIATANTMLICKNCGKPSRTSFKIVADGAKGRVCKKCGKET